MHEFYVVKSVFGSQAIWTHAINKIEAGREYSEYKRIRTHTCAFSQLYPSLVSRT